MGFLKKIFGDAADELKKNLEDAKKEMLSNLEEVKQDVKAGFTNSTSNSRDDGEEDDEEPKILLGDFHDGVLTIREGITELDDESLEHYKRIRKIIFPASLERLDSNVIDEQERLEELDFSKVTKLKTIPDDFISGENKVRKLIIPNGVTEVGDGFLGEAKSGAEIFVPDSVRELGYITGNNDNDMTVYLFAANIDISDVEEDVKTLYVLPQYYGWYAKALKKCDSEARLREMPEEMMGVYGATSLGELKEIAKDNASLAEDSKTESVDDNITDIVQKIKEKLQALDLSSFILYGNDYEGNREYDEVEQLGDEGLLESSSEYAINYNDSYDGNSSVYTKVRKIEIQESGVTFDIEEIYEDNDGDEESRGFHEAQTIDRILESCNRDTVKRGLENILTYLNDETLIKLNKNTENESMPEPVLEPKPEPEAETKVEVEQKEEPIENGGLFSARLEAMIAAALQDGVLTDKEREILKRRVEKEGEDWDEVEMIIESRLAEMNPVTVPAPAPESESEPEPEPDGEQAENVNDKRYPEEYYKKMKLVEILPFIKRRLSDIESLTLRPRSKIDAFDYLNKLSEIVPETEMSVATFIACAEFYETDGFFDDPEAKIRELLQIEGILQNAEALKNREEQIKDYRRKLMDNLKNAKLSRDDSEQAEKELKEAVEKVKLADISIKEGAKSVEEIEQFVIKGLEKAAAEKAAAEMQALQIEQMKRQMEEQAKAKEVPALKVDKPISKEYVKTEEDKYATSIDIPEGVTIIPDYCFHGCSSMESITLPSTIKQIGKYAFSGCSALTSIDIPEGVTIIPDYCFDGCSSMERITLPSTIKQIGKRAFFGCSALTSIDIPEGVTIIPNNCFDECSSLESITLPSTIKQIGKYAFSGCSSLTSIDIPEGVTIISNWCFCKCKKLNSVTLPTTIKKIENYAFNECNKLKTISIPNGCERIEELSLDNNIINELFLPPTLCAVDGIDGNNLEAYCFAPHLEDLSPFFENNWIYIYVLPQYLDSYKSQAEAEGQDPSFIRTMPEEYLYYYDN